jgi:hypothetical protein
MIIFCSSDPGAQNIFFLLKKKLKSESIFIITSNLSLKNFKKNNKYQKKTKLVVTGSSIGYTIDKKILNWAIKKKIPTISFIDNWTWYRERFFYNKKIILPNKIIVNDKFALSECLKRGFSKKKLYAYGNPDLEKKINLLIINNKKKIKKLRKLKKKKIIYYISEPIKKAFELNKIISKKNEFYFLKKIISFMPKKYILKIKLHPKENFNKYKKFITRNIQVVKKVNIKNIIFQSEYVFGIISIFNIILAKYRNDINCFKIDTPFKFVGEHYKLVNIIRNDNDLLKVFLNKKKINNIKLAKKYFIDIKNSISKIKRLFKETALKI